MNRDSPRTPPACGSLARLRQDLDDVAEQAREPAAGAVGRSVATEPRERRADHAGARSDPRPRMPRPSL
jgi:hypothetical protein